MEFETKLDPTFHVMCNPPATPDIDPNARSISDRYFVNLRSETYRLLRARESVVLAVPWGPRVDVIFDPKGASHVPGGRLRVLARTAGTEVEIGSLPISSADAPIALSAATGCDEYVVKVSAGQDLPSDQRPVESYIYARVYDGR